MAQVEPLINSFVSGELSPRLAGRTDIEQYYQSAKELTNMIVEFYGGAKKAPGTYFVAEVKTSSKSTRIIKFVFSDTQAYIIEVGDLYMRFYKDDGQITSTGSPYEIVTPYVEADLFELQLAQTADILYITHPNYAPRKLTRTAHTSWTLTPIDYSVDPARPALMPSNVSSTTITPSAATGTGITLTASVAIFDVTHVGSIWQISGSTGYVKITSVATGGLKTVAIADVIYGGNVGTSPVTGWAEGSWSDYRGYPRCVTFNEQRLIFAYTKSEPQTVWGSQPLSFDTFELGASDDDGLAFTLATNQVEVIRWLFPSSDTLIGTPSSLHTLGSGSSISPLTPSNVVVKRKSSYGASSILPQQIGNYFYYWQNYNKILREYAYTLEQDNYESKNATAISEHITGNGIIDMDYQQSPLNILWCVRDDGALISFTRQIEQKVSAWAYHETDGDYESVAVIPKDTYDEIWFVVKRTIGGATKRYIEYMVAPDFDEPEDAFFVHSGLIKDEPKVITGATAADPIALTVNSHGFSNLDVVKIRGVEGMTELNYKKFIVAGASANGFHLHDLDGADVDGILYKAYISGGEVRKCFSTLSGLSHLEGKTVQVLVDGASHPNRSVASGAITLDDSYSEAIAGLGYTARIITNDLEGAPGKINSQGSMKRVSRARVNLYRSLGCKIGTTVKMDSILFRTSAMPTDQAPALFTGIKDVEFPSGWDKSKEVIIEQEQPLPMHVLSVGLDMEVN